MDGVESVSVHVVGKAARASDSRNEDSVFRRDAEFRHLLLHLGQDRVVAASGAPAHFLVGNEILTRKRGCHFPYSSSAREIRVTSSDTLNGRPWILLMPIAGIR